jgi:hypothetical protein
MIWVVFSKGFPGFHRGFRWFSEFQRGFLASKCHNWHDLKKSVAHFVVTTLSCCHIDYDSLIVHVWCTVARNQWPKGITLYHRYQPAISANLFAFIKYYNQLFIQYVLMWFSWLMSVIIPKITANPVKYRKPPEKTPQQIGNYLLWIGSSWGTCQDTILIQCCQKSDLLLGFVSNSNLEQMLKRMDVESFWQIWFWS